MRSNVKINGDAGASEMEEHLLGLLKKVQDGEIFFLATTATGSNGEIEQRHIRCERGQASGRRCARY